MRELGFEGIDELIVEKSFYELGGHPQRQHQQGAHHEGASVRRAPLERARVRADTRVALAAPPPPPPRGARTAGHVLDCCCPTGCGARVQRHDRVLARQRNSHRAAQRDAGDRYEVDVTMDAATYVRMMRTKVFPAIRRKMGWLRNPRDSKLSIGPSNRISLPPRIEMSEMRKTSRAESHFGSTGQLVHEFDLHVIFILLNPTGDPQR